GETSFVVKGGLQGYDAPGSTRVQHACKCSLGGGLQQLRRKRSAHHRGGRNRSGLSGDWPLAGPEQLCTPGSRSSFLLLLLPALVHPLPGSASVRRPPCCGIAFSGRTCLISATI